MKIVAASVTPIRLALAAPLATAHGTVTTREGAALSLTSASGTTGWGEALPLAAFGLETAAESVAALERIAAALVSSAAFDLDAALDFAEQLAAGARSAQAATDFALFDLAAREQGVSTASLLNSRYRERVALCALITANDPRSAAHEARRAARRGFGTLKLKLGADDLVRDEERVAAVRDAVGPGVGIRLDANGAWKEAAAFDAVWRLAPFAIELLEQPVPPGEVAALARVRTASPIPIAADESVSDEDTAAALLDAAAADVLVLKPAAVGGLRPAWRIAERARRADVAVVVTSFLDSSLGIAAALQLAAALPDSPLAAGLATAELLKDDLAPPLTIRNGAMTLQNAPGLGISPAPLTCASGAVREFRT